MAFLFFATATDVKNHIEKSDKSHCTTFYSNGTLWCYEPLLKRFIGGYMLTKITAVF
jgi:hypothetical protein